VKRSSFAGLAVAALFAPAATAGAQQAAAPQCQAQAVAAQDACQIALDLFAYTAPQLGAAISGGNATLGQGGTLGGLGHFSIGVRANAVRGSLPQIDQVTPSTSGIQRRQLPTKENQPVPMPVADAAFGIFRGFPVGVSNVGGLDVLVNVSYIPTISQDGLDLSTPNGSVKFGYGARLGILQESVVAPGVSVTYLKRDLPEVSLDGATANNGGQRDTLSIRNLSVGTSAWRLVASKHFVVFGLAAGVGQDKYTQSADIHVAVRDPLLGTASGSASVAEDVTRTNMFADLSLNLPVVKLIAEVGQVSGGSVGVHNTFATDANASRLYGSVGLRFAW
jgi:hypothetical protein